jgi:hypothetical protein
MGIDPMFPLNPGAQLMLGATRVTSVLVRMEPAAFRKLLDRMKEPLVVVVESGVFKTSFHYLTSYKGLTFYTKSDKELGLPNGAEVITAEEISLPD